MEQAFGDPIGNQWRSMTGCLSWHQVNDWLLVFASGDLRWSAAGHRQPRESAEVDSKLLVLALLAGDSVPRTSSEIPHSQHHEQVHCRALSGNQSLSPSPLSWQ